MGSSKTEFPPLLGAGFYEMTVNELRDLCVSSFPHSKTRELIMSDIEDICNSLVNELVFSHLWINGSFLTQKIDPDDSDIVVCLRSTIYHRMTKVQRALIKKLSDQKFKCDSYVFFEYSENDPLFSVGEDNRNYWIRQFGFSRNKNKKGIAVIDIGAIF